MSLLAAACFLILSQAAVRPAAAAWLANASGNTGERAAGLARGLSWDADPSFLKRLSWIYYEAGEGRGNLAARRAALAYSLEAAELRPFDSDALYFAGASLERLERPADGRALIDAARAVRFPPMGYPAAPGPISDYKIKLKVLRALGGAARPPESR
jgi:hypothetical protein